MRGVGRGRRETEMDGVKSPAVQGHCYGERQFTDAQRRSGRGFGKMTSQEVGEGGIMSTDRERRKCMFVCKRERQRPRGRHGEREKKRGSLLKSEEKDVCREMQK